MPEPFLNMPKEKMNNLIEDLGVNWLAGDGVWFRSVETEHGMFDTKRCNESC